MHCRVPLPVHSSSTTDSSVTGARGEPPSRFSPATAPMMAASPDFMSAAPRPYIQSPSREAWNGAVPHRATGSGLTTSMCPFRISDRPGGSSVPGAGSQVATTLALPPTSQEKGECPGCARRASASIGTSIGRSPNPSRASRISACPGSSSPSTVGAATSLAASSSIEPRSCAIASRIARSRSLGVAVAPGGEHALGPDGRGCGARGRLAWTAVAVGAARTIVAGEGFHGRESLANAVDRRILGILTQ